MFRFSIITCTYNSYNTLIRVYNCLLRQNFKDFEWILVDDCSAEESRTRELIDSFIESDLLEIKKIFLEKNYIASESVRRALKIVKGEYVVILDHDDELFENSLQIVNDLLNENRESEIAGVIGRCENQFGKMLGKPLSRDNQIFTQGQLIFEQKVISELIHFTKPSFLIECFKGFKPGFSNGYSWAKSSHLGAKYVVTNQVLRKYYANNTTSISHNQHLIKKYSNNISESMIDTLLFYRPYLFKNLFYSIIIILNYYRNNESVIISLKKIQKRIDWALFFFIILIAPVAFIKNKSIGRYLKFGSIVNVFSK